MTGSRDQQVGWTVGPPPQERRGGARVKTPEDKTGTGAKTPIRSRAVARHPHIVFASFLRHLHPVGPWPKTLSSHMGLSTVGSRPGRAMPPSASMPASSPLLSWDSLRRRPSRSLPVPCPHRRPEPVLLLDGFLSSVLYTPMLSAPSNKVTFGSGCDHCLRRASKTFPQCKHV